MKQKPLGTIQVDAVLPPAWWNQPTPSIHHGKHTLGQSLSPGIMDDLILKTRFGGNLKGPKPGIFPPLSFGQNLHFFSKRGNFDLRF